MTEQDASTKISEQQDTSFDAKAFIANAPKRPGVYRMYDAQQKILYVGKAKQLKKRLSSYFRKNVGSLKTQALVKKIVDIELTITHTEIEALLLEQELIKSLRPPYNILLRDDKTYPYIIKDDKLSFARFKFFRSVKRPKKSFGPFPSTGAVKESLQLIYKVFKLRQCEDSVFSNRSRPCLQYQIGRCSAPCVDYVDVEAYKEDMKHAELFLQGKNELVTDMLTHKMQHYAEQQEYEQAARYRDQIQALRHVQSEQFVSGNAGSVDVFAIAAIGGNFCVSVLFIRQGSVVGNKAYYPKSINAGGSQILAEFIAQFYLGGKNRDLPKEVVLEQMLDEHSAPEQDMSEQAILEQAIEQAYMKKTRFVVARQGAKAGWLRLAQTNATQQLKSHLNHQKTTLQRVIKLQEALGLDDLPKSIECFDISHTQGKETVASCVVFDQTGPQKKKYRRFNIHDITPGDDYAAMKQVLERRYSKLLEEENAIPDIVLIDGGKGQLSMAIECFQNMGLEVTPLWGISKGEGRKAGLEILHHPSRDQALDLSADNEALHLLQFIRDEAHRFAITGHRKQRARKSNESPLELIEGVGSKRRQALLKYFGGWQALAKASVDDIAKVPNISRKLAEIIYNAVHTN